MDYMDWKGVSKIMNATYKIWQGFNVLFAGFVLGQSVGRIDTTTMFVLIIAWATSFFCRMYLNPRT